MKVVYVARRGHYYTVGEINRAGKFSTDLGELYVEAYERVTHWMPIQEVST